MIVAASAERILMLEGEMKEVSEKDLLAAMQYGHQAIKGHCTIQQQLMEDLQVEKNTFVTPKEDQALKEKLH